MLEHIDRIKFKFWNIDIQFLKYVVKIWEMANPPNFHNTYNYFYFLLQYHLNANLQSKKG